MKTIEKADSKIKNSLGLTEFFKGIAILMVILVHSHQIFDLSAPYNTVQKFGQMGCQMFFVLSSFGLCHSFSKKVPNWFEHMKKRISKLAVGYWGAIILHAIYRLALALFTKPGGYLSALNIPGIVINALFLNGIVPFSAINNTIVRGGWYVGTTVILYALFPLLYAVYFSDKYPWWKKYRTILFPVITFLLTVLAVVIAEQIHPIFICKNNSFVYFSFVNQLTPFSLGLVLFDICRGGYTVKKAGWYSLLTGIVAVVLFYANIPYSFVLCPTFVACSFMLLYRVVLGDQRAYDRINSCSNGVIKVVRKFGKISYPIYLTHSFIVYELSTVCLSWLRPICGNDLLWYAILLPIEIYLVYLIGHLYDKVLMFIKKQAERRRSTL